MVMNTLAIVECSLYSGQAPGYSNFELCAVLSMVKFVAAKIRVAPLQAQTVLRLELLSALLLSTNSSEVPVV